MHVDPTQDVSTAAGGADGSLATDGSRGVPGGGVHAARRAECGAGDTTLPDAGIDEALPGELARVEDAEARMITLYVLGTPAPKGSGRAILIGGKARHVPSGSNTNRDALKSWDVAVREAALAAVGDVTAPPFVDTAIALTIVFHVKRPGSHYRKDGSVKPSAPARPKTKPDWSKLARATEDSLNGIVFDDDARVCDAFVSKRWASPGREGATITVTESR